MHIIDVGIEKDILAANRKLAEENKKLFDENGVRAFDFLGAIGSGKTMIIERLIEKLSSKYRIGAITGDVSGNDDYLRLLKYGIEVENVNTGKECHLDAHLIQHAIEKIDLANIDLLFIENVGNLVCPADFPLGTEKRIVVISVTEGDDMVRKHPVMFGEADLVVVNKIDLAEYVGVNPDIIVEDYKKLKSNPKIVKTNAKSGEGIEELISMMEL